MIRRLLSRLGGKEKTQSKTPAGKPAQPPRPAKAAAATGGKVREWSPGRGSPPAETEPARKPARGPTRKPKNSAKGKPEHEPKREAAKEPAREPAGDAKGGEAPKRRRRRRRRKPRAAGAATGTSTADAAKENTAPGAAASGTPAGGQTAAPAARSPAPAEPWDPASYVVEPCEGRTRFHDLGLRPELLHAVSDLGFEYCTPIQAQALPALLQGRDVAGRAQTGTGKTAAFLLAIFQKFLEQPPTRERKPGTPRALVIAPTRELVMQIERDAEALGKYCPFNTVAVYGGSDYRKQRAALAPNPELIAATPGRLLDFRSRHELHLNRVEVMVIDEADRMLDMGFIPDVRKIIYATPPRERRQTMLFSATLTSDVLRLASSWTREAQHIDIEPEQVAVDSVDQRLYIVTSDQKFPLLYNLLQREHLDRVLMFVNRRDTAERLAHELQRHYIDCALISGALPQDRRTKTLAAFREGRIRILVATDVAGRGLHIEGISHVVNYNIPIDPEDYVHRIGRTGRAGATGTSVSFACEEESFYIPDIEKYMGREIQGLRPPEDWLKLPADLAPKPRDPSVGRRRGPPRRGGGGGGRGGPRRGGGGSRRR